MEKLNIGGDNNFDAEVEQERKLSEEHYREVKEQYPTIESIVDDYRNGKIMWGEVMFRFPDQADQDEVLRLAEERSRSEN